SHQTWPICYHHSDFLHALLLVRKCAAGRNKMKGSNRIQQRSRKKVQPRLGSDLRKIEKSTMKYLRHEGFYSVIKNVLRSCDTSNAFLASNRACSKGLHW